MASSDPAYFRPVTKKKPDPISVRGTGRWVYKPDLASAACRKAFYDDGRVALKAEDGKGPQLHPAEDGQPGYVVLKVYAANVITSMQIAAAGTRAAASDVLRISVSRDAGLHYKPVWEAKGTGPQTAKLALLDEVAGVTQCLIKIEMQAARRHDVGLDAIDITTITQLNRLNLPKLTRGPNEVVLRADRQAESAEIWPSLHAGKHRELAVEEEGVRADDKGDGGYKATLGAAENNKECFVTWRLDVPTDITAVTYVAQSNAPMAGSYVSLQNGWENGKFKEFYRHRAWSKAERPADGAHDRGRAGRQPRGLLPHRLLQQGWRGGLPHGRPPERAAPRGAQAARRGLSSHSRSPTAGPSTVPAAM